MTNQEINERIAKLCGWIIVPRSGIFKTLYQSPTERLETEPPNYTDSLDACREFEDPMMSEEYSKYRVHLFTASAGINSDVFESMKGVSVPIHFSRGRAFHNATPLQRCEAFLRLNNQWE